MHVEIWDELIHLLDSVESPEFLVGILKKLLAIPREHAKTTLIKLAIVVFLRYSRLSFCAYVSNTAPVAMNAIRDIRDFFCSSNDAELFGPSRVVKSSEQEALIILDVFVPGRIEPKRIIMKAFGQGTQIRGTVINNSRPDILVFDDIESRETVESELQQKRLDAWATGTAFKAMARRGVCIFIGNMIGKTSLLARLSKDSSWNATVLGALVKLADGSLQPLWPSRWTLDALVTDYISFRSIGLGHVWEAEMMNLTSEAILGESLDGAYRPMLPAVEDVASGFICLDPAFGLNGWNDDSAISVHVKVRNPQTGAVHPVPILAAIEKGKFNSEQQFDRMLELSYYWGITTWVIESQAAQRLLLPLFMSYFSLRGLPTNLITMIPILAGKESKASRIVAFRTAVSAQAYGVVDNMQEFISKLENYSPLNKDTDDDLDSAAYGTIVWARDGLLIEARGITNVVGAVMGDLHGGSSFTLGARIP